MAKLQKKSLGKPAPIKAILQQFWGYDEFRPMQEEIINSVLSGRDTLALMPTGGGKSLTFQVPAMALEGICLVITPLIALMKDQVDQLNGRKIKAAAIHSGMTRHEISVTLDNCIFGDYKFLYLSPERLRTELFLTRIRDMKVNLLAVDEAHCISQWGYDFRPSYLQIRELREHLKGVPLLALTATATPEVCKDIQEQLGFEDENQLKLSFNRENLTYVVRRTEDKQGELLQIIRKLEGCGIVYTRNRRKSRELALLLKEEGMAATYYHAGLGSPERERRQQDWTSGKIRIMVATNAFGMGIDKADVRFVIHMDLPDSPEAYFQEAGRAGRDLQQSWAILLFSPSDARLAEQRISGNFPGIPYIRKVYSMLCKSLQVPQGSGKGARFDFDFADFLRSNKLDSTRTHSALSILSREGYIHLTDAFHHPSRVLFISTRDDLYQFQVRNAELDGFIKLLLRSYSGMFTSYTAIDEAFLSRRSALPEARIREYLQNLSTQQVIRYIPRKQVPVVTFLEERLDEKNLYIDPGRYKLRKERYTSRMKSMVRYASSEVYCRNQFLLGYFGELKSPRCGRCDVCLAHKEQPTGKEDFSRIQEMITKMLSSGGMELDIMLEQSGEEAEVFIPVLEQLLEEGLVVRTPSLQFILAPARSH